MQATFSQIIEGLNAKQGEALRDLLGWADTEETLLKWITSEYYGLDEAVTEWADGQVSVYHSDRFDWATHNYAQVAEHEEEALANGTASISDAIAYCWMETERQFVCEAIDKARDIIKQIEDVAE